MSESKNNLRIIASSKGGKTAASNMTSEQKFNRSHAGGLATLNRFGSDYFSHIRSLRKSQPSK